MITFGAICLAAGALVLWLEWWYSPRAMVKVRERTAERGDPRRFDEYLTSRRYRLFRIVGSFGGLAAVVLGAVVLAGGG